jgi:surface antigen/LysM repeat protein
MAKTKRKTNAISKLASVLSSGLLGRENIKNLRTRIIVSQKSITRFIKERRTIKALHVFRNYSAFIVVISSAILVSATNLAAGRESSGFLFGYFGETENYENPLKDKMYLKTNTKTNLALAPLAESCSAPDPELKEEDSDSNDSLIMKGQAFLAGSSPVRKDPEEDGGVAIYEVRNGDTVSAIAASYKISINTILWANEMDNVDEIMPGDKIFILPISGFSYTVKKGDDIDSISKKYKTNKEKIIAFNNLPANGELEEGEEIMLPDGEKEVPRPTVQSSQSGLGIAARPYQSFETSGKTVGGATGGGHRFPYGYCTWYVASRKNIPWGGNAGTWLYHAKAAGYATGKAPRPGSIMVSSESWWGHVAIVESVSGGSFTISEMNYRGWGKKSTRTIPIGSRVVKGFIY